MIPGICLILLGLGAGYRLLSGYPTQNVIASSLLLGTAFYGVVAGVVLVVL